MSATQLQVLDRGASVAATFERGLSAMTESQEAIETASAAARQIMDDAKALVEETREQLAAQAKAADVLRQSWDAEKDTLNNLKGHFLALTSELGDKILEFRGLAAERIGEVFHSFDSEMGKVTEHLGGTLADLRETTEDFPGIALRLVDATSSLEETSKTQHESLAQGLERLETATGNIAEHLQRGREELIQASGQLPGLTQEMSRVGKGSDHLAESVQQAGSSVSEWVRKAEDADQRSEQQMEQLSSAASAIETAGKSLNKLERTMIELPQKLSEEILRQQQAIAGMAPPARIDGTSPQASVDGRRSPTQLTPRPVVGSPDPSDPPAVGRLPAARPQVDTTRPRVPDKKVGKLPDGEVRSSPQRVGSSSVEAGRESETLPVRPDDSPGAPRPTGPMRWIRRLPFIGRNQ